MPPRTQPACPEPDWELLRQKNPSFGTKHIEAIAFFSEQYLQPEAAEFTEDNIISNLQTLWDLSNQQDAKIRRAHAKKIQGIVLAVFSKFGKDPSGTPGRVDAGRQKANTKIFSRMAGIFKRKQEQPPAQKIESVLLGHKRLEMEFSDEMLVKKVFEANKYGGKQPALGDAKALYDEIVGAYSKILYETLWADAAPPGQGEMAKLAERAICELWGLMNGNLTILSENDPKTSSITNGNGMLWEALHTKTFDCDTSACLAFDIFTNLGLRTWFIAVPNHALLQVENTYFETTTELYYNHRVFAEVYTVEYGRSNHTDRNAADAIAINNIGIAYSNFSKSAASEEEKSALDRKGIECYDEAIRLNPRDADALYNRGAVKDSAGDYNGAIADLTDAISINPEYGSYAKRGNIHMNNKKYAESVADFNKAVIQLTLMERTDEISKWIADIYVNRAIAKFSLGDFEGGRMQ